MNKNQKRTLATLAALAITLAIVNASVFVYYPIKVSLSPVAPPIIFSEGSNANKDDLRGNNIEVSITEANTNLTITVHPTYQTTYYKNISVIRNLDISNNYHVYIKVVDTMSRGNLTSAYLIINKSKNNLVSVDLTSQKTEYIGLLNANSKWSVNLNIILTNFGTATYNQPPKVGDPTAEIQLIYSKTDETPP